MSQTELGSPDDSGANTVVPGDTSGSTSDLPSYAQLQQSEGPRFGKPFKYNSALLAEVCVPSGRWHDWIEKRARERRELRAEEGLQPTSWDLASAHETYMRLS